MDKKLWKCKHCGLETQGYGVYSHQQSCAGYADAKAKKQKERERQWQRQREAARAKLRDAIENGAVEDAKELIDVAKRRGFVTPTRKMRSNFLGRWHAEFEAVVENSDIGKVLDTSANAGRCEIRNPASAEEIQELEALLEVAITQPMSQGTFKKLKRMSAEEASDSPGDEKLQRDDLWRQVANYTDYSETDLYMGLAGGNPGSQ